MIPGIVTFFKVSATAGIESADGFRKVPVVVGLTKVELFALVICQYPRKDGILIEIVVSPS